MKVGNLSLVKNMNNSLVWNYLAENGGSSITEIAKSVGLSFPTVNRALETGLECGLIAEGEINNSSVGRKPQLYKLNRKFAKVLCLLVNADNINCELKDFSGETLLSFDYGKTRSNVLDDLVDVINSVTKKYGKIDLASISLTGVIAGPVVLNSYIYPALNGINIPNTLFLITGVRVIIENNMRILAYTANSFIKNKDEKTVSILRIGKEGIGSCNIIRGKIQRGNSGFAGEVGYLPLGERNTKKPDIFAEVVTCIISVLAPHELIIYNDSDNINTDDILKLLKKALPSYAMPQIIDNRSCYEDQMYGIFLMSRGYLMAIVAEEKDKNN